MEHLPKLKPKILSPKSREMSPVDIKDPNLSKEFIDEISRYVTSVSQLGFYFI